QATDVLLRNYRTIARNQRDTDATIKVAACYSIIKQGEIQRGCIRVPEGQSACEAVREELDLMQDVADECNVCLTDKCNGSTSLQVSLGAMILIVGLGLKSLL
ncbi:hypothetical protein KR038_006145, partial [Drosophila bunnanda]